MLQDFPIYTIEIATAAVIALMQAAAYVRLLDPRYRQALFWGYSVAYTVLFVCMKLAEDAGYETVNLEYTVCTLLIGAILFALYMRRGMAGLRFARVWLVVAMMFALAEWTLFMTLSETSNHGIGRNTDWNNRLWLNVIKASFFGCFLLLMYTLWTLAVRRKTARSRLIFALLLSSQLFALGVLLYLGLAAGSSRTFTVLAATAVVFAAADLGFFAAMREVDRIDSLRRLSEAEKQYVENQADYFRALSERARFDNLLQERLRSRVAGAIQLLEARHVDGYRDWILNPAVDGDTRNLTLCENSVVNALLLTKLRTMEERGIAGRIQVRLASRTEFDDLDLCCVFGNLLDNAIEASAELATEKDIEPVVELIGAATGGFYVIRCRNRCLRQPIRLAEGRIQSGKRPEGEYGLGLLIIGEIAQKYGGRFDFDCEERDDGFWFRATVWLGLTNADNPAGTPATGREAVAGHAY